MGDRFFNLMLCERGKTEHPFKIGFRNPFFFKEDVKLPQCSLIVGPTVH